MKLADKGISLRLLRLGQRELIIIFKMVRLLTRNNRIEIDIGEKLDFDTTEQIAKHQPGHALGLGHPNFSGDLISDTKRRIKIYLEL